MKSCNRFPECFHDERAIDIVLDNKIASLYPAVQDLIEKKLAGWKKNNLPEKVML